MILLGNVRGQWLSAVHRLDHPARVGDLALVAAEPGGLKVPLEAPPGLW